MPEHKNPRRTVIMGAAGRDFHNFNMVFRDDRDTRVVAFTATQIPAIAGREYPPSLAGPLYPEGIEIIDETELARYCRDNTVDRVVFAYSDVTHEQVMHKASIALAAGADFTLLGPRRTMIEANVPVIAVCAIRTGCGKSQVTRWLALRLKALGLNPAVIRHPMPYGDLAAQAVQRFANLADIEAAGCTIEEREEYEPLVKAGINVHAGVDYAEITRRAGDEADILIWDGGNNDFPFIRPDLHIVLVDPLRPGDETTHHPGEAVLRMADIVLISKSNSAASADIEQVADKAARINPRAVIVRGASRVKLDAPGEVRGKRVLVVEDGPTITHGGMAYGAGLVAAREAGAAEIVDPRRSASAEIAEIYAQYPHIGPVLPAVGYFPGQLDGLRDCVNAADADVVVQATPCDLTGLIAFNKPVIRATYDSADTGDPALGGLIDAFVKRRKLHPAR